MEGSDWAGSVSTGVGMVAGVGVSAGVGTVAGAGATFFGAGSCTRFRMDGLGLTMVSGETNPIEDFTGVRVSTIPCIGADRLGFSALPWLPRECYLRAFLLFYPNVVGIDLHQADLHQQSFVGHRLIVEIALAGHLQSSHQQGFIGILSLCYEFLFDGVGHLHQFHCIAVLCHQ